MPKRMYRYIRSFFNFSHAETKGFLGMLCFLALLSLIYLGYRNLPAPGYTAYSTDKAILDSLVAVLEAREQNNKPVSLNNSPAPGVKYAPLYFEFNPNDLPADSLVLLGIPAWLAQRIQNYRQKGGQFRKKEDLQKIYDFPDSLYQKLVPYIRIAAAAERKKGAGKEGPGKEFANRKPDAGAGREKPKAAPFADGPKETPKAFDINEADSIQLQQVSGIGPVLSGRIIKFRNLLGGFSRLRQLYEVYGLDTAVVERLLTSAYIREDFQAAGLNINTASQQELAAHPYISPVQARLIYNYRKQHGIFQSVDDLQKIHTFEVNFVQKIAPYVRLD